MLLSAMGPPAWAMPGGSQLVSGKAGAREDGTQLAPAELRAMAPTRTGPRAKPRSRSRLVVALAMPILWRGTVLTARVVMGPSVKAKPRPTRSEGSDKRDRAGIQ